MSAKKAAGKTKAGVSEAKVVALAEQLGWFLGSVQAKADGWLDREKLRKDLAKIRDGATQLLQHVDAAARSARIEGARLKAVAKSKLKPAAKAAAKKPKPNRGPVDAPGKRHRKPPPQVKIDKRMGEPVGKQMGRKTFSVKTGGRMRG
ncbi:MAG: hypothetical protein Q8N51_08185 [Gammaproteobacteria bacterium]|nr:hypothetical protein [Gammaproteobacteria bacterium]